MEIKNRLFPYPVLCETNDDYEDCSFCVNYEVHEELNYFVFDFQVDLINNDELSWLIHEGKAEYVIHVECSSTSYRTVLRSYTNKINYKLKKSRVNGKVELVAAIVAVERIKSYSSQKLNEDYSEEIIDFDKGSILAYQNLKKLIIVKNYEELSASNTIFTIIKRVMKERDEINPVTFLITESKIKIFVDEVLYNEYIKYSNNKAMEPITNSLLVMPALSFMIETLRAENNSENYSGLLWYRKINKACQLQGVDFEDYFISSNKTSIEVAQELLNLPINDAFVNLSTLIEV